MCPTSILGKINPFRVRIAEDCTFCRACIGECRYEALTDSSIQERTPDLTCTLCGDCLGACRDGQIGYRFRGLDPAAAKRAFLVIVVATQALFVGFGRI